MKKRLGVVVWVLMMTLVTGLTVAPQVLAQADNQLEVTAISESSEGYLYELSLKNKNGNPIMGQRLVAKDGGGDKDVAEFCVTGSLGQCTLRLTKGQSVDDITVELNDQVQAYSFSSFVEKKQI